MRKYFDPSVSHNELRNLCALILRSTPQVRALTHYRHCATSLFVERFPPLVQILKYTYRPFRQSGGLSLGTVTTKLLDEKRRRLCAEANGLPPSNTGMLKFASGEAHLQQWLLAIGTLTADVLRPVTGNGMSHFVPNYIPRPIALHSTTASSETITDNLSSAILGVLRQMNATTSDPLLKADALSTIHTPRSSVSRIAGAHCGGRIHRHRLCPLRFSRRTPRNRKLSR